MPNKENLKPFKKGEDSRRNINGRPRKSFAIINSELKAKGITELKKAELIEAYSLVFNSTEDDLKDIAKDKHTPYALKLIILELNDKKARARAMSDYRDYMFGKAQDSIDYTTKGKEINIINLGSGINPENK